MAQTVTLSERTQQAARSWHRKGWLREKPTVLVSAARGTSIGRLSDQVRKRDAIISADFIVVAFSIIVRGLTMTPLLRYLGAATAHHPKNQP